MNNLFDEEERVKIIRNTKTREQVAIMADYIDQNSVQCDCCQHVMIDVTALPAEDQHCIVGDPEAQGVCAYCMNQDLEKAETREKALREELKRQWFMAHSSECENLNYGEHTGECTWPMPKILEEK